MKIEIHNKIFFNRILGQNAFCRPSEQTVVWGRIGSLVLADCARNQSLHLQRGIYNAQRKSLQDTYYTRGGKDTAQEYPVEGKISNSYNLINDNQPKFWYRVWISLFFISTKYENIVSSKDVINENCPKKLLSRCIWKFR